MSVCSEGLRVQMGEQATFRERNHGGSDSILCHSRGKTGSWQEMADTRRGTRATTKGPLSWDPFSHSGPTLPSLQQKGLLRVQTPRPSGAPLWLLWKATAQVRAQRDTGGLRCWERRLHFPRKE